MKVLLVSRIPPKFELKIKKTEIFPNFQIQSFWLSALKQMQVNTQVFIYSKSILMPQKLAATLNVYLENISPKIFAKIQKVKNVAYAINPANYIRSFQLLRLIKQFQPDRIIVTGGISSLVAFPFKYAKSVGIRQYLLHGEDPVISATLFERRHHHLFNRIIVNDPTHVKNWQKIGAPHALALPYSGIDPKRHNKKNLKRVYPLVFVGTLLKDRQELLKSILPFKPRIYGFIPSDLKLDPILKPYYFGEAWGEEMIKILNQAQIAINVVPPHMPVGGNLRMFEIPACGALQIANRCPAEWFKDGKEIVLFSSNKTLVEKLKYLYKNPVKLKTIAKAGYDKVHSQYTYQQRFNAIFNLK